MTLQLRTRLLIAGALLIGTTVATGAWSVVASREVSLVVGQTVTDDQRAIDAASTLAGALEREDDALLLALSDEPRGRAEIVRQRAHVAAALERVERELDDPDGRALSVALRGDIGAYHAAVDGLSVRAKTSDASEHYLEDVNPRLRRAIGTVNSVRDRHFRSSQAIAEWARDRSRSSMQVVAGISIAALVLLLAIVVHLARVVMVPLREMSRAVQAIRRNDFSRRVAVQRQDELGRLGDGLNRMADDLEAFRRANIEEVIRAKETLEATLEALPDAVVVIGPDHAISSANPRAAALVGATKDGKRALEELPIPRETRAAIAAVLGAGAPADAGVDLTRAIELSAGGPPRKLLPRVVPIAGLPDGQRGAVLVLSDVTELVRLDQMRLELVAVASHELRTPLTTLRMTLLMLAERAATLGARDRELVTTAMMGIEQLSMLVDEFLDLTRIEAGELRLQWTRVSPRELIERCTRTIAAACEGARIALEIRIASDLPATIAADPSRLATVMTNLLSNAVRYTPVGGRIAIEARAADEHASLELEVTDSGPGVPAEHRERVFERFFRVEHTGPAGAVAAREVGTAGVGIGLYIARQIIQAHGGTIGCDAAPEGGARFVVKLPIEAAHALREG